jgi:hypothetical protein
MILLRSNSAAKRDAYATALLRRAFSSAPRCGR